VGVFGFTIRQPIPSALLRLLDARILGPMGLCTGLLGRDSPATPNTPLWVMTDNIAYVKLRILDPCRHYATSYGQEVPRPCDRSTETASRCDRMTETNRRCDRLTETATAQLRQDTWEGARHGDRVKPLLLYIMYIIGAQWWRLKPARQPTMSRLAKVGESRNLR